MDRFQLRSPVILLCLVCTLAFSGLARSADPHAHEHHAAVPVEAPAERWQTDAPLRQSMEGIRDLLAALHDDADLTPQQSAVVAEGVKSHVQYMIAHCKLAPEADAALHTLIGQMLQGAGKLSDQATAKAGIEQIDSALTRYPTYFDHPDWAAEHHHH